MPRGKIISAPRMDLNPTRKWGDSSRRQSVSELQVFIMTKSNITSTVRTILLLLIACTPLAAQRSPEPAPQTGEVIGKRIIFADGSTLDVDDTWKQADTVWYRRQGTSQSVNRDVRKIENLYKQIP